MGFHGRKIEEEKVRSAEYSRKGCVAIDLNGMLKGLFGRSIEEKARHQKWAFSAKKSELSKRTKAGHKQTSGKRQEY